MNELFTNLVKLIERNADKLSQRMVNDIKKHPGATSYHTYDEKKLYKQTHQAYSQFLGWMADEISKEDVKNFYTALAKQQRREGFALSEVVQALIITRRHIWLLIDSEGSLDSAFNLRLAIDVINRAVLFFDRAIYFTVLGFDARD
jgi:hypothetical protein